MYYGQKGEFLSCLISLALVIITSKSRPDSHPNTLIFHNSKPVNRLIPAPPQHELQNPGHGTKVTVTDLFGSMPVRVKQRAIRLQKQDCIDRDWDDLRHSLAALLIAYQKPVKIVVSDASKSRKLAIRATSKALQREPVLRPLAVAEVHSDYVCSILSQAGYMPASTMDSWVTVSARGANISVEALVSLEASPTKQVQFISFGMRPLSASPGSEGSMLFDIINQIFAASRFGSTQNDPKYESSGSEPRKRGTTTKGVNRWPMFCCRIEMQDENVFIDNEHDFGKSRPCQSLQTLLDIISALFRQFLKQYYFLPGLHMDSRNDLSRSLSTSHGQRPASQASGTHHRDTSAVSPSPLRPGTSANTNNDDMGKPGTPPSEKYYPSGTDFSSWSRIKASQPAEIERLSSAVLRPAGIPGHLMNKSAARPSMKRRVFSDTVVPLASPAKCLRPMETTEEATSEQERSRDRDQPSIDDSLVDESILYLDPETQQSVFLNSRTGQSILSRPNTAPAYHHTSCCHHSADSKDAAPTDWIDGMIKKWHNPVFRHPERSLHSVVPQLDLHENDKSAFFGKKRGGISIPDGPNVGFLPISATAGGRLTKENLCNAELISQVDNKFLLVKVRVTVDSIPEPQTILVLIDQHAADERCRIEKLFADLVSLRYQTLMQGVPENHQGITILQDPILFTVSQDEAKLFERYSTYFASWGCHYEVTVNEQKNPVIAVDRLPSSISERCRLDPNVAINMLRGEVWSRNDQGKGSNVNPFISDEEEILANAPLSPSPHHWSEEITDCPKGIIELLNSRACRSAIMFNDVLNKRQCCSLISRLSQCSFPFQCAHGRPSMVPIVNLGPSHASSFWKDDDRHDRRSAAAADGGGAGGAGARHHRRNHQIFDDAPASSLDFIRAFGLWQERD